MPRVLIDAAQVVVGGGIQVALALLEHASKSTEMEFHAATSSEVKAQMPDATCDALASIHALPNQSSALRRIRDISIRLPHIAKEVKPDLVFTVFGPPYWRFDGPHISGFALPKLIYPVEHYLNEVWPWTKAAACLTNALKAWACRQADAWIAETDTVRKRMHEYLGFPLDRIEVVRNSYSTSFARSLSNSRPQEPTAVWTILVPSAYYSHKDLERVPETARLLQDAGQENFLFRFTIPKESSNWGAIKGMALDFGVGDRLYTVGAIPHERFSELYLSSDVVFLPTLLECSTAVYPEAFLAEKPLVTTDLDFARELCGHGALFFEPRSAVDAARALMEVRSSASTRARLIEGGKKALRQNYPSPEEKWREQVSVMKKFLKGKG
ncbi:MAG: glycosyltransferase family 4 protein [Planctomycetes bacterium]|nr:glycosyltransferase family 4 protein [Planctomycetota bacterium]